MKKIKNFNKEKNQKYLILKGSFSDLNGRVYIDVYKYTTENKTFSICYINHNDPYEYYADCIIKCDNFVDCLKDYLNKNCWSYGLEGHIYKNGIIREFELKK